MATGVHERFPSWSPDGSRILYMHGVAFADSLGIVNRDGSGWGAPQLFLDGSGGKWSPDGKRILFRRGGTLRTADIEGNESIVAGYSLASIGWQSFSVDGRKVYCLDRDDQGVHSIWSVPAAGGKPRELIRFDDPNRPIGYGDFATDGTFMYFTLQDARSEIWELELDEN